MRLVQIALNEKPRRRRKRRRKDNRSDKEGLFTSLLKILSLNLFCKRQILTCKHVLCENEIKFTQKKKKRNQLKKRNERKEKLKRKRDENEMKIT